MITAIVNFFKSLLLFLIVAVVAIIPCAIFNAFALSPTVCYILGGILGAVILFIFYMFALAGKWTFFYEDDGYPKKAWKANLPLLFHVLLGGGAIVFMALGMDLMNGLHQQHSGYGVICLMIAVFADTQLVYWLAIRISHGSQTCPHCKYIYTLCYGRDVHTQVTKERQYKTETARKEVGGLYSGSTKIASVNADVSSTYGREVTRTTKTKLYTCSNCGTEVRKQETESDYSKWK